MHELGICDALRKMVSRIAAQEGADSVTSITVEVGTLSGVVPRFLADGWEAVTDGTPLEGTEMRIETVDGTAECLDCGAVFTANLNDLRCPECRGAKLTPLTGRDLTLKEILLPD